MTNIKTNQSKMFGSFEMRIRIQDRAREMSCTVRSLIAASCVAVLGSSANAQHIGDDDYWRVYLLNGRLGYAILVGIIVLLLFVAVAAAVSWLMFQIMNGWRKRANETDPIRISPREILEERFARGEIDKNEFQDRKRALGI